MKTILALALLFALPVMGQDGPTPEQCVAASDHPVSVTYASRNYELASEECREQFLSDPERYSQLYDALRELETAGTPSAPAAPASLVPS
jgi:hypothetical protein